MVHCTTEFSMQSCAESAYHHMQMRIVEVFVCRHLQTNTSIIPVCIRLKCRLCTALHTKRCGAQWCGSVHAMWRCAHVVWMCVHVVWGV